MDEDDDDFDMFADDDDFTSEPSKQDAKVTMIVQEADPSDDVEGYYAFRIGEVLNGQYQVVGFYGKGAFSNVIRAVSLTTNEPVAIKLLRNNAYMKRSGRNEMKICKKLSDEDPLGEHNIIKMKTSFEDRDHLCLVFEPMDLNLRQVIKKYGNHVGLSIKAVRFYAYKLLKALKLLKTCGIVHGDIKPDNILVDSDRTMMKLGDLGTAFYADDEFEITPMLGSRFYRAPEIILGYPYAYPLDTFSVGCCLYEIATGNYCFQSEDNNHHIQLVIEAKGQFNKKTLNMCEDQFRAMHFTDDGAFLKRSIDVVTGKEWVRKLNLKPNSRSLTNEIVESYKKSGLQDGDMEVINKLADLVEKCTLPDPTKRITPEQALVHPLFLKM